MKPFFVPPNWGNLEGTRLMLKNNSLR